MKLKTNKTFAKDQQEKLKIKIIRIKLEKKNYDKSDHHQRYTSLGVSISGSVRFSPKKLTKSIYLFIFKSKPKPNRNRFKPNSFGSVNWKEKPEKTDSILAKHIEQVFWNWKSRSQKEQETRKFEKNNSHNIHYSNRNMNIL
jgi:hypothetical protein